MFGPALGGFLRLPVIEHVDAVGVERVVGAAERVSVVGSVAGVASRNPGARDRAAVVTKVKTLGDFHEVGSAPDFVCQPRGARLEECSARGTRHEHFAKFSLKAVEILSWDHSELSN